MVEVSADRLNEESTGGFTVSTKVTGADIPPAKLAMMKKIVSDKSSDEYQRITWEALKKSIHGLINKVNSSNLKNIVVELFAENLIRGRGHFCKTLIKAQYTSPSFTSVYACLIAVINSKLPTVGELILKRLIIQFRRSYKRNDKVNQSTQTNESLALVAMLGGYKFFSSFG